jgi:proline dehydrogenase
MRISHILEESRRLFRSLSEEGGDLSGKSHASVPYLSRMISRPNFVKVLEMLNVNLSPAEQANLFSAMDVDKNGVVDYVEWLESVQPNDATLHPFFCTNGGGESLLPKLNERELQQMDNMVDRLERLAERAAAQRVHLMVDAEQTYFQPAIDHMVLNLQKKFNRDFPAIYNTYPSWCAARTWSRSASALPSSDTRTRSSRRSRTRTTTTTT